MSFEEARAYLEGLGIDAMKAMPPSLHRIEAMCEALDHPERAVPAIHVTGTNGKTSTARIASSVLTAAGLSVGTFTSPHLQSVRERLTLAGEPISEEAFAELFDYLWPHLELVEGRLGEKLTYFELLTAMFFLWAAEQPMDAVVVEVGLGGLWDATNVVSAPVAVITNIGLDHTGLLGNDTESIAREKVGIVKPTSVLVTAERKPGILSLMSERALRLGAEVSVLERDFAVTNNKVAVGGRYVSIKTRASNYEDLFLPLHGSHQAINAATALEACARFLPGRTLEYDLVAEGLAQTEVPGRLETVSVRDRAAAPIVLDVAHNPDGMSALVTSLLEAFAFDHVRFVIGVLHDKDYGGMLAEMSRVPCSLIVTRATSMRSVPTEDLAKVAADVGLPCETAGDVPTAVDDAIAGFRDGEIICVTGSHYVVGEARSYLLGEKI